MRFLTLLVLLFISSSAHAQDTSDVTRIKNLSYMKLAYEVNCDSTSGSNLEDRICLNLKFQQLDSVMNLLFKQLLGFTSSDSLKKTLINNQLVWVANRRIQSEIVSEGFTGNSSGIIYLSCMNTSTESRIRELEFIVNH